MHTRRKSIISWTLIVLLVPFLLLGQLTFASAVAAFQGGGLPSAVPVHNTGTNTSSQPGAQVSPENPKATAVLTTPKPLLAPPANNSRPFLRLLLILLTGLAITAFRLASKFRRFLGLGVFTNMYSILFLLLGAGICGFPVTSESALSSQLGTRLGPWITDLSGVIVALVLPAIRFKNPMAKSPVADLEADASSNPIIAIVEEGIRDHILARMRQEIDAASRRYEWEAIKSAAYRALEEEITVGRLKREEAEVAIRSIEGFQSSTDPRSDADNKYTALIRLLRWCSFSRLRDCLAAAVAVTQR